MNETGYTVNDRDPCGRCPRSALSREPCGLLATFDSRSPDFGVEDDSSVGAVRSDGFTDLWNRGGEEHMKFDDNLLAGLFIGVTIGLHYGVSLSSFMPIFLVLGVIYLLRYVKAR